MIELTAIPTAAMVDREIIRRRGFVEFVRRAWHMIDTSPLRWSWHMDAIAEHLQAVTRRDIRTLVINVPPKTSKSSLVSVLWPCWTWTLEPDHRWLCASHTKELADKNARKSRTLMESPWFRDRWPEIQFSRDKSASVAVSFYENTQKGWRQSVSVPSSNVLGGHPDTHNFDDPNNPGDARAPSKVELHAALAWLHEDMPTRFRDHERSAKVCTMQRVHELDIAGEMIRQGATVLALPMRFEPKHPHAYTRAEADKRGLHTHDARKDDELLDPVGWPLVAVESVTRDLGPIQSAAQLQQRPAPAEGAIFRAGYFAKRWVTLPNDGVGTWTQVWDCTFKGADTSDWVVGQVWFHTGADHYLVDQVRGQWGLPETLAQITALTDRYPRAIKKLVEGAANGFAVVELLKTKISGFKIVGTEGGLESWANASEPLWSAGNVVLPHATEAKYEAPWCNQARGVVTTGCHVDASGQPWPVHFVAEHLVFPRGKNDDTVAASSQYLRRAGTSRGDAFARAMKAT